MPEKHSPYYNLMDALKEKHCPICFLARRATTRFFDDLLYERTNDPGIREGVKKSKGFCERHFWQLVEFEDGYGISSFCRDLLLQVIDQWKAGSDLKKERKSKRKCLACEVWDATEKNYVTLFCENITDPPLKIEFNRSQGLCLTHFKMAYRLLEDEPRKADILNIQIGRMESLVKELEEFDRKHDYRFSHEGYGPEGDSWLRAVELLKGNLKLLKETKS